MSTNNRKNSLYNPKFKQEKNKNIDNLKTKENNFLQNPTEKESVEVNEESKVNVEVESSNIIEPVVEEIKKEQVTLSEPETLIEVEDIKSNTITEEVPSDELVSLDIVDNFSDEQISELQFAMNLDEKQEQKTEKKDTTITQESTKQKKPHYQFYRDPITKSVDILTSKKTKTEEMFNMSEEKIELIKKTLDQVNIDIIKYEIDIEVHQKLIIKEELMSLKSEYQSKLEVFIRNLDYLNKKKKQLELMLNNL